MEVLKHAAYRADLHDKQVGTFRLQELQFCRQKEIRFEFRERSQADSNKSPQFNISHSSAALRQIGRNRDRCATHLRAKPIPFTSREAAGCPVD